MYLLKYDAVAASFNGKKKTLEQSSTDKETIGEIECNNDSKCSDVQNVHSVLSGRWNTNIRIRAILIMFYLLIDYDSKSVGYGQETHHGRYSNNIESIIIFNYYAVCS